MINVYEVEFWEEGRARISRDVMGQTFVAAQLTPDTNYFFRVAGANTNGTGPFTDIIALSTDEDGMTGKCSVTS